jgi:diketogulonate reductase-like aldo/keto reductase
LDLKDFGATGVKVSEIGMGTYYDPPWIAAAFLGWKRKVVEKVQALKKGLESGVTLLDTAEIYRSEPVVARALEGIRRDEVFVASKVWTSHLKRDSLLKAFEGSMRRLGLSYLDLYQVHWPNPRVPVAETMGAMEELVKNGKLRHIGVSNFSLEQLKEAESSLHSHEVASIQIDYSLMHRSPESGILPYCEANHIALLAYYPLGHGRLPSDPRLDSVALPRSKTRSQVALRWLASKRCVFPIPRASSEDHVAENVGASGWELSREEVSSLESKF